MVRTWTAIWVTLNDSDSQMKEQFIEKKFRPAALTIIQTCNEIISAYTAEGYRLSVRQLYYQLVSRNVIENSKSSYDNLVAIMTDARMAGLVDWDAIEDRGRQPVTIPHWTSPREIIATAAEKFRIDKWLDQPAHVEVMVEKAALEGVLIPVCNELDVTFHANKGYSSVSAMYEVGKRLQERHHIGKKKLYVVYCGDHDPSGMDMSRDVADRLALFSQCDVTVLRVALNMKQIERYNPPEQFAKQTDSRWDVYQEKYGDKSWELDALEPKVLAGIVRSAVLSVRDETKWNAAVEREEEMKAHLQSLIDGFPV